MCVLNTFDKAMHGHRKVRPSLKGSSLDYRIIFANFSLPRREVGTESFAPSGERFVGVFMDRKVFRTDRTKVRVFLGGSCIRFDLQATRLFPWPCVRTVHEWHLDRLGWQAPCYLVRIPGVRIGSDELTSHDPQIIRDPKLVSW